MFHNLLMEMKKRNITCSDIANITGVDLLYIKKCMNSKKPLPLDIAIIIKDTFFSDLTYEYLFKE